MFSTCMGEESPCNSMMTTFLCRPSMESFDPLEGVNLLWVVEKKLEFQIWTSYSAFFSKL
jgi:aminopeptidase-like protein